MRVDSVRIMWGALRPTLLLLDVTDLHTAILLGRMLAIRDWVSPRANIRFDSSGQKRQIFRPDGQRFLSYAVIAQQAQDEQQRAEAASQRAEGAEAKVKCLAKRYEKWVLTPMEFEGCQSLVGSFLGNV